MGGLLLAFVAGTLSVLSPCVLPLLPVVVGAALQQHRHGPLALGVGLVVSAPATLAVTGADKRIEAWRLDHMPEWIIALTTSI